MLVTMTDESVAPVCWAGEEEDTEVLPVADDPSVAVTGQIVVEMAMISVVTDPDRAGQSVMLAAHEVMV